MSPVTVQFLAVLQSHATFQAWVLKSTTHNPNTSFLITLFLHTTPGHTDLLSPPPATIYYTLKWYLLLLWGSYTVSFTSNDISWLLTWTPPIFHFFLLHEEDIALVWSLLASTYVFYWSQITVVLVLPSPRFWLITNVQRQLIKRMNKWCGD